MKKKRILSMLLVMTMVMALLAGCGKSSSDSTSQEKSDDKSLKIGTCVMDMGNPYFVATVEGYQAYCDAHGYQLVNVDGASSAEKQVSAMENFISVGCDVIDLRAIDSTAMPAVIKSCNDAGIPVTTYPDIEGRTSVLKYDDYDQGAELAKEAAKWINDKLGGQAEVAYLTQPKNAATALRTDGFDDVLSKECAGAKVVARVEAYVTDTGMSATESILQAHPNVKVILCINDSGALGAYEAVKGAGKATDDFFIGGIDGNDSALQKIAEGGIYRCTIAGKYLTQEIAWKVLDNICNAKLGKPYDEEVIIEVIPVNADNVKEYLARTPSYPPAE